jgi:hypothetical protein
VHVDGDRIRRRGTSIIRFSTPSTNRHVRPGGSLCKIAGAIRVDAVRAHTLAQTRSELVHPTRSGEHSIDDRNSCKDKVHHHDKHPQPKSKEVRRDEVGTINARRSIPTKIVGGVVTIQTRTQSRNADERGEDDGDGDVVLEGPIARPLSKHKDELGVEGDAKGVKDGDEGRECVEETTKEGTDKVVGQVRVAK